MLTFEEDDLTQFAEYAILCDMCESEESTRDGSSYLAIKLAIKEGFVKDASTRDLLCPHCAKIRNGETK